ncbi:MAG: FAD-binding oxidoreductase [Dehalococcoidales bacterium]|nr:FAD-binding oxidoreductase [Dehalococcoidales bacterium]
MALSREIYQQFEDIVGTRNISDDPAVLDTYVTPMAQSQHHMGPAYNTFTPRGQAVLMPGSTEEVQAIVKLCNKYRIKFKAASTFWTSRSNISDDYAITLDMRRMDRILEIDRKNQYAVIEPYVIGATLQAEAMKVGLNTTIIGAGSSCSPLASACANGGPSPFALFGGLTRENLLAFEWVMPDGEILRSGSLGSDLGWFCDDGPGPGLRGVIMAGQGSMGAMGVFTRCAIKLFPWPGPPQLESEGIIPAYKAVLPANITGHTVAWPTWKAYADGLYRIWDSGISGYYSHRQYTMFGRDLKAAMIRILTDPTRTLNDLEELLKDPELRRQNEEMQKDFQIVLAGMTSRDIEWQEKVLDKILAETGGCKASLLEEPGIREWNLLFLIRLGHKNLNFVFAGGYEGAFGIGGVPDYSCPRVETAAQFKRKWELEHTSFVAAGGDCMMGGMGGIGGGGTTAWENFTHFDSHDRESVESTHEYFEQSSKFGREKGLGAMERMYSISRHDNGYGLTKEEQESKLAGFPQPLVYEYQWKIRNLLDPNLLGDPYYVTLEPKKG